MTRTRRTRRAPGRWVWAAAPACVLVLAPGAWADAVVQAPAGGAAVRVAERGVVCAPLEGGWRVDADGRGVVPPAQLAPEARSVAARVAPDAAACGKGGGATVRLVALGALPEVEPADVIWSPDDALVELRGRRLRGAAIEWRDGKGAGREVCVDPVAEAGSERCVIATKEGLDADVTLRLHRANAQPTGDDVRTFDAAGAPVPDAAGTPFRPGRVVLRRLFPAAVAVDVSSGSGSVRLLRPQVVLAADCAPALCEVGPGGISVRGVPAPAKSLTIRLRLAPRVLFARGDALEGEPRITLPLAHCPLTLASGAPLRDADALQLVVALPDRCAAAGELRWEVGAEPVRVVRTVKSGERTFVQLDVGRITRDQVTVTAFRAELGGGIIGSITAPTAPSPRPQVDLSLPGHGEVGFIPTNRDAVLRFAIGAAASGRLVPLPLEGVYTIQRDGDRYLVRGAASATGFTSVRFGYRDGGGMPPELAGVDLALVAEPVQRALQEASLPAPFAARADGEAPLAELLCGDDRGGAARVRPGTPTRVPFALRDTCRVVVHQERLRSEDGTQSVFLEVEVTGSDGRKRTQHETMLLRPQGEPRSFWIRDASAEFDRVVVRLSHVRDEPRYVLSVAERSALPALQWTLIVAGGRVRLYATVAIPAGLYRMTEPTGQLTLNFGVLTRITRLDDFGKEWPVGLELGLTGMGLIQSKTSPGGPGFPATFGVVGGMGLAIPLGSGASIGVHVWGVYEVRKEYDYVVDTATGATRRASRFAFVFGPSITIGSVGRNL